MVNDAVVYLTDSRLVDAHALQALQGMLSAQEHQRCQNFVRAQRQRQFVIGRALLRRALAALLNITPSTLALVERPGLGPCLAKPHGQVGMSISHSAHWVACAVSANTALGLDIELLDPSRDIAALAEQAFDVERSAWLAARPAQLRTRDFYTMWSEQEARIKLGQPDGQCVSLLHAELSVVLCSARPLARPPRLSVMDANELVHEL